MQTQQPPYSYNSHINNQQTILNPTNQSYLTYKQLFFYVPLSICMCIMYVCLFSMCECVCVRFLKYAYKTETITAEVVYPWHGHHYQIILQQTCITFRILTLIILTITIAIATVIIMLILILITIIHSFKFVVFGFFVHKKKNGFFSSCKCDMVWCV